AVDWIEDNKFQLTYLLNNPEKKSDIGVKVLIDRENPEMESIHHLWKQAKTYQRELREMFGINFPGSPKVDEPFILEGWTDIPPYRRDFDTKKYSEETYFPRPGRSTNDPATYMKQKLYPDE
ncbi:MAG: NADH-quinone oxidoreductase subunit C, partial [Bacteroidota bacterium]